MGLGRYSNPAASILAAAASKVKDLNVQEWEAIIRTSKTVSQLRNVYHGINMKKPHDMEQAHLLHEVMREFGKLGSPRDALQVIESLHSTTPHTWMIVLVAEALSRCFAIRGRDDSLEDAQKRLSRRPKCQISWNLVLAAYARSGDLTDAKMAYEKMPIRDEVSWSSMIAASTQYEEVCKTQEFFERMPMWDAASWTAMVAAFAQNGDLDKVARSVREMPWPEVLAWNLLILACCRDGYLQLGLRRPTDARLVWSRMVADHGVEAVKQHYRRMSDVYYYHECAILGTETRSFMYKRLRFATTLYFKAKKHSADWFRRLRRALEE